jgi:hypothetical protein
MCAESAQKSTPDQIVRPDPATVRAKRREIACRYKNSKKEFSEPFSMAKQRVAELRRLFVARYGNQLPDDDAGRGDAKLMIDHIAAPLVPGRRTSRPFFGNSALGWSPMKSLS